MRSRGLVAALLLGVLLALPPCAHASPDGPDVDSRVLRRQRLRRRHSFHYGRRHLQSRRRGRSAAAGRFVWPFAAHPPRLVRWRGVAHDVRRRISIDLAIVRSALRSGRVGGGCSTQPCMAGVSVVCSSHRTRLTRLTSRHCPPQDRSRLLPLASTTWCELSSRGDYELSQNAHSSIPIVRTRHPRQRRPTRCGVDIGTLCEQSATTLVSRSSMIWSRSESRAIDAR